MKCIHGISKLLGLHPFGTDELKWQRVAYTDRDGIKLANDTGNAVERCR